MAHQETLENTHAPGVRQQCKRMSSGIVAGGESDQAWHGTRQGDRLPQPAVQVWGFESSCAKLTHVYRGRVHRWMLWQRIAVIIALVCATPCEGMAPGVQKLAPDFRSMSLAAKEDFVRRQVRAVKHARRLLILILGGWRKTDGHLAADRRASRRKTVPCVQQNLLTLRLQRQGRAGCDWRGVHTE